MVEENHPLDRPHVWSGRADGPPFQLAIFGIRDWLPEMLPGFDGFCQMGEALVMVSQIV